MSTIPMFRRSFTGVLCGSLAVVATAQGAEPTVPAACDALSVESCTIQSLHLLDAGLGKLSLELVVQGRTRNLRFWEHDVRGPNYRLIVQESDGTFTDDPIGPCTTYRGQDILDSDARMALGIESDGFRLRIIDGDGSQWFAEPLIGRVDGADASDYGVYAGQAIISPMNTCPVDETWRVTDLPSTDADQGYGDTRGGVIEAAEMAVDADYEFYQLYGSSAGVEARVNAVINSVNLQYEGQCQLTHELQAIVVRSSNTDPYSSNDIETRLDQLRADWNSGNHPGIARDIVHLFTGANTGSTIGLAYLGAVCTSFEYGVVQSSCCGSFGCATDLSAHEMGHNWNAGHCNCSSYTMNPSLTCANQFTTGSVNSISSYANLISSCLHTAGPSGACCIGSTCTVYAESLCESLGGLYQGDSTDCGDVTCENATGACCLTSGACATVAESQCDLVDGDYQGDNVPCDDEMCLPDPTGACCYFDNCTITEEVDCIGAWLGADTTCTGTPCTDTQFSGMSCKVLGLNLIDDPQDTWTIDIYAMMGAGERLDAVAGNSIQQKVVSSSHGFYQNGYGGGTSQDVNPAFYPLAPDLVYDSRVTIGALDSSGDPFLENNLNNIGIDFTNFENGGTLSTVNGTWFVLPIDDQGEAATVMTDDCNTAHGVLIGRFTLYDHSSEIMVEALFQGRNALGVNYQQTASDTFTLGNWADCNDNGTNDACDIAGGGSNDDNNNGIPDECESECEWDLNGDGITSVDDLLLLIANFGGQYDVDDLLALLSDYGCE